MPEADNQLLKRIRDGDERALEEVFRTHYASMTSYVERLVRSPQVAEELVQDVFLKFWRKRAELGPIETLKTYLFRAARNHALNYLRREKLERRWQDSAVEVGGLSHDPPDAEYFERELAAVVAEAVDRLPPRCREVFLLSRDAGLSYLEIAQTLGLSVKTVETQMGRALRALRLAIERRTG
jgi:RNA polymerase sigma-70 factor (ECF subfamily)